MKKKGKLSTNIDTLIILAIAAGILFLNIFTTTKLNEFESARKSAIFIRDDIQMINNEDLSEEIKEYIPEAYKMIEVYDEKFDLLFQIQFNDPNEELLPKNSIHLYPTLYNLLSNNDEGQTSVIMGDQEENVYFKWVTNSYGERRLLIVYNSANTVSGIWLFSLVCYLVLILVFILLIRMHSTRYHDKINQYREMTNIIRAELNS